MNKSKLVLSFWILTFVVQPFLYVPTLWRNESHWDAFMLTGIVTLFAFGGIVDALRRYIDANT